jgi:hypothetical protein
MLVKFGDEVKEILANEDAVFTNKKPCTHSMQGFLK